MTLKITEECIGCSACVSSAPELFEMKGDVAVPKKTELTPEEEQKAKDTAEICPVDAIKV
ncbi:MAG: ferredoxin [Candidatus Woesearchaeota archaeon]